MTDAVTLARPLAEAPRFTSAGPCVISIAPIYAIASRQGLDERTLISLEIEAIMAGISSAMLIVTGLIFTVGVVQPRVCLKLWLCRPSACGGGV